MPDVEIPGTKVGLRTIIDITRSVFGIYPKHISGDIVVPVNVSPNVESPAVKQQATVTVYITHGQNRSAAVSTVVAGAEVALLVKCAAETALGQVNPYVLAAYREEHREYDEAVEILERMIQDPSENRRDEGAAFNLWGNVLGDQKRYDEAIAKYEKAIEFDPKLVLPYNNWGVALRAQGKYDEAIAKYQKAIELDPKLAPLYNNWGLALQDQKKYDEAIAKYQKAIELDPKFAAPYNKESIRNSGVNS